jgi:RHS repeat-associated protein
MHFANAGITEPPSSLDRTNNDFGKDYDTPPNTSELKESTTSETKFEGLDGEQAEKVDGEAFPKLISEPAGGPPKLVAGESIMGYPADNAAQVDLPEGKHGVIESMEPMAIEPSPGQREPIDLSLNEVGGAFQPLRSDVALRIPKHLADGVQLTGMGISLTPVDAQGNPLGGSEGSLDGTSVIYANTQIDTDTMIKPTTGGVATHTFLRSVASPSQLYFRVGLPSGASLVQSSGSGIQIVNGSEVIAGIPRPVALDAAGTAVPVSMSVSGNMITLTIESATGSERYPIDVDPEIKDTSTGNAWVFGTTNSKAFWGQNGCSGICQLILHTPFTEQATDGQYAFWEYPTQGESHIFAFKGYAQTSGTYSGEDRPGVRIESPGNGKEGSEVVLPSKEANEWVSVCPGSCSPEAVTEKNKHNSVFMQLSALVSGERAADEFFMRETEVAIEQEKGPLASTDTFDKTLAGQPNIFYPGTWVSTKTSSSDVVGVKAFDPGIGVASEGLSSSSKAGWGYAPKESKENECQGVQCNECYEAECTTTKAHGTPLALSLSGTGELPEGEDPIEAKVQDDAGLSTTVPGTIKVDNTPPHNLTLTGMPAGNEISEGEYHLAAEATDGSGSVPSSGVKSLAIAVDGREIGKPNGSCSLGPCTAKGEWVINSGELGVGEHQLKLTATDNAGNVAVETFTVKVRRATPVALGPGEVNPQSGEFALEATDVSVSAPGSSLEVTRGYRSRHLTAGAEGPLGPQWSLSVGSQESITKSPNGNATLASASGGQTTFVTNGTGGFTSPTGDTNLGLSEVENAKKEVEYVLKDASNGATTRFIPTSSTSLWKPSKQEGPIASQAVRYLYEPVEGVTEPKYALAPEPAGVTTCLTLLEKKEELVKGCRALEFKYDTSKTATGEGEKQWGEYVGRLKEVLFVAYSPATKAIAKTPVAHYLYDTQGRLRAEWNPKIEPELKTVYGYDAEGHVTSLTQPGQESWAFTYGTITGEPNTGRIIKATQAQASVPLWKGEAPTNTEQPKVSGTADIGGKLSVSTGVWGNEPVSYGYQWEDCNAEGKECTPILGATNANYDPASKDIGKTLVANVTATNGGGTLLIASTKSAPIAVTPVEYTLPAEREPSYITAGPDGNLWYTEAGLAVHHIGKITTSGVDTEYSTTYPGDGGITEGPDKKLWFIGGFQKGVITSTTSGAQTEYYSKEGYGEQITAGPNGNLWFTVDSGKIDEITTSGTFTEFSLPETYEYPHGITTGPDGNLWFAAEYSEKGKIGKMNTAGAVTEYELPGKSDPEGITVGPDGNLWYVDYGTSKIGKITTSGIITEYALPSGSAPFGITSGPEGNLWFTETSSNKIGVITTAGAITEYSVPSGSEPYDITVGPDKNIWFTDRKSDKIGKISLSGATGEPGTSQPGWTVEYKVPVSGTGAPYALGSAETATWGQTADKPAEGMAIIPPDEPQTWPATSYKRATISYLDVQGRIVNTATPGGGISTAEYNKYNDVVRTLSPDNRAIAVAAKEKSAEVAKELSTESTYNETGSEPGTELLNTLGPKHNVELTNGTQVEGREHTIYSYNEGAPTEGGPYHLATTTTEGAEIAGKEEPESVRTTKTSYKGPSGHETLGWTLREPTSITTDPTGLSLVHATEYEPSTGNVIETKMPAAAGKDAKVPPAYSLQFGTKGTGGGQFEGPEQDAIDSHGDVWVADYTNHRIEELSSTGTFMLAVGWGVKDGKAEAETCTSSCKAGISGSGSGQFEGPYGIAVNQSTNNVYVADYLANRVEELSSAGAFVATFGAKGTAGGDFSSPEGVAIDSSGDVWVADSANNRIQELSSSGTFMLAVGWGVKDGKAEAETCTASCEAGISGSGNGQLAGPSGIAFSGSDMYVSDYGNDRVDEFTTAGAYVSKFGSKGTGTLQFESPSGIAAETTSGDLYVADGGNDRVQKFTAAGAFVATFGSKGSGNGQLLLPVGVAVNSSGDVYVGDHSNNRVEQWVPAITGSEAAHDTKTIYYSTAANSEYKECGEHAEWANLPCITKPAAQPGTSGLPELPTTKYAAYNVWDEPESTIETVGSTTRTKTDTYDEAGRLKTSATASTVGTTLPTVTYTYSKETGALEKESAGAETITSTLNTLGQLASYTDASGVTSAFEYDIDGRIHKTNDGKGTQTYTYNEAGLVSELVDSSAAGMKFTATYDVEGNMLTEGYPNGMNANYTYNAVGTPTALEYKKITHCTEEKEKCKWLTDTIVPSIHGQWLSQTSTLSKQAYTYDQAGRLTEVQNTPTGGDCTTRIYGYDEDTNRTSLTTRSSSSKECATEGGSTEWHTYDTADRLTGTGLSYNTFGDITAVPALGTEDPELTSAYYVDNQLASQKQKEQTIGYNLDPAGRTIETVSTGKPLVADTTFNYDGPGGTPSWTNNATASEWSRNIPGINGSLAAIQNNGGSPVLQLTNLHGDIIATASTSETATELTSKTDTSEFGVPTTTSPSTYSWLGAGGSRTELPSGAINMGARSYVPQLGRFLQPDPIPGGSASAYSYTYGDPVNSSDPSGEYTATAEEWAYTSSSAIATAAAETRATELAAIKAAEEATRNAAIEAAARQAAEWAASEAENNAAWAAYKAGYAAEQARDAGGGGGRGGRSGGFTVITYKGGPGATCGSNSTNHRKCHEPNPSKRGEGQEWCEAFGSAIGGIFGSPGGVGGATVGAAAGAVAGKVACKE